MVPRIVPLPGYVAIGIGSVMIEVPEYVTLATAYRAAKMTVPLAVPEGATVLMADGTR